MVWVGLAEWTPIRKLGLRTYELAAFFPSFDHGFRVRSKTRVARSGIYRLSEEKSREVLAVIDWTEMTQWWQPFATRLGETRDLAKSRVAKSRVGRCMVNTTNLHVFGALFL